MNRRDAINQIRQFGGRLDRLRKSRGGTGGGRNAPDARSRRRNRTHVKQMSLMNRCAMPARRAAGSEKQTAGDVSDGDGDRHLLTLPSVCYMVYKNVNRAATQYYPSPQITVYLQKRWMMTRRHGLLGSFRPSRALRRSTTCPVRTRWENSATGRVWRRAGYAGREPATGGGGGDPKLDFQSTASLNTLRDRISQINGIDEVRMDDSWFAPAALTGLVGRVSAMIGVLMVAAVFLVIGNSVRLSILPVAIPLTCKS